MRHAVEKHFRRERERAAESFQPVSTVFIEQDIGKESHIQRTMPLFLTLRDEDGRSLVTAMLPPGGRRDPDFACIIVGPGNADPYAGAWRRHPGAGRAFRHALERSRCYPYRR